MDLATVIVISFLELFAPLPPPTLCKQGWTAWQAQGERIRNGRELLGGFTSDNYEPLQRHAEKMALLWWEAWDATWPTRTMEDRLYHAQEVRRILDDDQLFFSGGWWH
jgi:hypothetical protein